MPRVIIDNRDQKLVDHINRILGFTETTRFAVGQFTCLFPIRPFAHSQPL